MGYSAGMINSRVKIARRVESESGEFGRTSGGQKYTLLGEYWAAEDWNKSAQGLGGRLRHRDVPHEVARGCGPLVPLAISRAVVSDTVAQRRLPAEPDTDNGHGDGQSEGDYSGLIN